MVSLYLHAYIRNNTKQSSRWLQIARNNRNLQQHEMLMPHDDPTLVCSANDLPHLNHSYDSGAFQIESKLEAILTMLQERFWAKSWGSALHEKWTQWTHLSLQIASKRCNMMWHAGGKCKTFWSLLPAACGISSWITSRRTCTQKTLVRQQLTLKQESYGKPGFFYWKPFQIFQILPA